jgi:uncharacterized protein (TIGR02231 family)
VTVSEDRAVVVRRGSLDLDAGTARIRVEGVAPVLVSKSLRVRVEQGDAKVGEANVVREARSTLPEDRTARSAAEALQAELDECADRMAHRAAAIARAQSELAVLDAAARATLAEVAEDAAHGQPSSPSLGRAFEDREKELHAEVVRLTLENRDERELFDRIAMRRAAAEHPSTRARAAIEIALSAPAPGRATIAIEYIVPGACWRPQHTATLAGTTVAVGTDGCVWQRTGEDWDGVELRLSTERPSLGKEPPRLADDVLAAERRQEVIYVEARQEAIQTAGLGGQAAVRVPGIDDGGEARVLVCPDRARVPTDGRPHRVRLGAFDAVAELESICLPQVTAAVILRSRQRNTSPAPLLAGPVDLVRSGGFVGRTKVPFVAPGERFELGWGPDPGVRVRHEAEEVDEEPGVLSAFLVRRVRERVYLSALDDAERRFAVTMRIPVSELEKVEVVQDTDRTRGAKPADVDGFVTWDIALGRGRARERIELAYRVRRHKDVTGL